MALNSSKLTAQMGAGVDLSAQIGAAGSLNGQVSGKSGVVQAAQISANGGLSAQIDSNANLNGQMGSGAYSFVRTTPQNLTEEQKAQARENIGIANGGGSGEDGFSPIAEVIQTATGAVITITDKSGSTSATITNGKDGSNGKDGVSATHSWNDTILTVTSASGTSSADLKGDKGDPGKDGYTPVKGVDYFDGKDGSSGKDGAQGYGFVASVSRPSFTEAQWSTYGEVGHSENWSNTESIRNGCRIGDIFTIVGTATDTRNAHVAYYRCTTASGNLRGECIAHSIAERGATGATGSTGATGATGATGSRGTGLLAVTTAPSSYTTEVGGITPKYRIAISTIKSQAKVDEVLLGDTVRYSYYHYPIAYMDASYAYMTTRVSIRGAAGAAGSDATVTAESIATALGYTPMNPSEYAVSVKVLGAVGDGTTDDTAVFQSALENNRKVYVPGGTYKLSGELLIGQNCQLELAQDVLLNFTQTSGNCISMRASSNIIGNHGAIKVPYAFMGKVINIDAALDASIVGVPPYTAWGPMWTAARYITDLHIVKLDYRGVAQSVDGTCSGTAVYLRASTNDPMNFLWAVDLTRLRISGAFSYGIHMDCTLNGMSGWIHQTRISAFVDGAEIGVYAKDSTMSYLSVLVIPRRALTTSGQYVPYAKWGIYLENCTDVDLSGSRVMDWNSTYSLWSEGSIYQHLALMGDCSGAILNESLYYASSSYDIRSLIYTDNKRNLERITILQEPFTRWFKPVDGTPYFNDGYTERRLMLREELDDFAHLDRIPNFTNKVPAAKNLDGSVFYDKGYTQSGARWNGSDGKLITNDSGYHGSIGLIPAKPGDIIRAKNLSYKTGDDYANIVFFDSNRAYLGQVKRSSLISNSAYYWSDNYAETEDGFEVQISNLSGGVQSTAYVAFSFNRANIGENPVITINEPLTYSEVGVLADTINVKSENIIGLDTLIDNAIDSAIGSAIGGSY